ncbi:chalcone isomerase family protein [Halopseudomonas pelagia]|uniref:chalcone isomerase family protein n=1 Tax=Halopseudomonas pelagia TaxID=553151 RepID=UPI0003A4E25B|nr:chalcone isomerase family protein [Halopseudomonas pelagia]
MLRVVIIALLCVLPLVADASNKRLDQANFPDTLEVDGEQLVLRNASVLKYLFVDVYSAALLTPAGAPLKTITETGTPLHLELFYYRNIDRADVIRAAWIALERQHGAARLAKLRPKIERLHDTFTDIQPYDRYSLTLDRHHALSLRYNGQEIFQTDDAELARAYVGIWLRENGLSDKLRKRLIAGD